MKGFGTLNGGNHSQLSAVLLGKLTDKPMGMDQYLWDIGTGCEHPQLLGGAVRVVTCMNIAYIYIYI